MNTRILFILAATLMLAQACKKKADNIQPDPANPNTTDSTQTTYPVSYRFAEAGNLSGIITYDSTGIVNAPNHRSTTIPYIVNVQDSLLSPNNQDYAGEVVTLLSPTRMKITYQSLDTTFSYTRSGNKLVFLGIYNGPFDTCYFVVSGNELRLPEFVYGDLVFQNNQSSETITGNGVCEGDPYAFFRYYSYNRVDNDTIAVRNFDLIYRKQ